MEIRLFIFLVCLIGFALLEFQLKANPHSYKNRIIPNFSLIIISSILIKIVFPFGILGLAQKLSSSPHDFALTYLPTYLDLLLTVIIFDFTIYWQHRLFHKIPILWKLHSVHHSDDSMDTTTALRFHPIEILISGIIKILLLIVLCPRMESYLIYEIILSSMAIFNHANIALPKRLEKWMRKFIATPSFHTPHHSPDKVWTNSNYGNFLSIWDYLFKSYTPELNQSFGLNSFKSHKLSRLLFGPFN